MSRTERKLRQALAEIEALRVDRLNMEASLSMLTSENIEMWSVLREVEILLAKLQTVERDGPPREFLTPVEFTLLQVRAALRFMDRMLTAEAESR